MKELVLYYVHKFFMALVAPIYFHFGHHWFAIEFISIVQELVDVAGLYLLSFFIIISLVFYRNSIFQSLNNSFFKNYIKISNRLPLLNYVSIFYNSFVNSISFLVNKFYIALKRRK